jgi:hypothetical protein
VTENFTDEDVQFFLEHPKRQLHIRKARPGERAEDFATLGFHLAERRRIIAWKVPQGARIGAGEILHIPFLQFADETIEDTDAFLLPILHQIALDGAREHGMQIPKMKLTRALE